MFSQQFDYFRYHSNHNFHATVKKMMCIISTLPSAILPEWVFSYLGIQISVDGRTDGGQTYSPLQCKHRKGPNYFAFLGNVICRYSSIITIPKTNLSGIPSVWNSLNPDPGLILVQTVCKGLQQGFCR